MGDASLFAATEAVAVVEAEDTAAELITCAAPLLVMAPAPTSPEEDASNSCGILAMGVTVVATSEGAQPHLGSRPSWSPALHRSGGGTYTYG
jgi:hypothetical protein